MRAQGGGMRDKGGHTPPIPHTPPQSHGTITTPPPPIHSHPHPPSGGPPPSHGARGRFFTGPGGVGEEQRRVCMRRVLPADCTTCEYWKIMTAHQAVEARVADGLTAHRAHLIAAGYTVHR